MSSVLESTYLHQFPAGQAALSIKLPEIRAHEYRSTVSECGDTVYWRRRTKNSRIPTFRLEKIQPRGIGITDMW